MELRGGVLWVSLYTTTPRRVDSIFKSTHTQTPVKRKSWLGLVARSTDFITNAYSTDLWLQGLRPQRVVDVKAKLDVVILEHTAHSFALTQGSNPKNPQMNLCSGEPFFEVRLKRASSFQRPSIESSTLADSHPQVLV